MANIHPDIKPTGMDQGDFVDALCMIVRSIAGICAKLDLDSAVDLDTYTTNCYTNIFTVNIEDQKGNITGNTGNEEYYVFPYGVSADALNTLMYQVHDSFETLTEQLDGDDGVADTDYEANCYTAKFLHMVENQHGNILGNGNTYYFNPGGMKPHKQLVEWLYNAFDAIETLTEQLDLDGTVNDTNYEALWFTAIETIKIENGQGNVVGN